MQKIKDFCKRHRLLWLTLLVALAAAAVAAWAGFDLGQRVDNQPVYEIVNDDYTRTVAIPATADAATQDDGTTGLYLPVPLKSGQRIYGVRLDLTTHNWAFRHGTLYAALLDADGNAVANGELDCITIKDNTFAAITFDAPYTAPGTADAEADYDLANPNMTLRLWYTPGDDWDVYHLLGLWTDADTSQQMTRRNANGTTDSIVGHPALQYVVNDSGSWSHVISRLLGVLTFAAVVAGFILLTHRAKLWQVVLVCGAVLGVAFAFLTPPLVGPDEYTHLAKCYRQSSTLLGQPVADDDDMLLVRSCDAPYFKNHTGDIGIYAYKEMLEHLGDADCSGETTVSSDTYVTADPINNTLYLGQIAGITLARMMGLGFHGMLLLGRLCNLALYLALAAAAVNIAPQRLRGIFAGAALLASGVAAGNTARYAILYPEVLSGSYPVWAAWADLLLPIFAGAWLLNYAVRAFSGFGLQRQRLGSSLLAGAVPLVFLWRLIWRFQFAPASLCRMPCTLRVLSAAAALLLAVVLIKIFLVPGLPCGHTLYAAGTGAFLLCTGLELPQTLFEAARGMLTLPDLLTGIGIGLFGLCGLVCAWEACGKETE